jgi:hypothetical protein
MGTGNMEQTILDELNGVAKTAAFSTQWRNASNIRMLALYNRVTAVSGTTPYCVATLEGTSDDDPNNGSPTAYPLATLFATGSTGDFVTRILESDLDRYWRITLAITGTTPSFTLRAAWAGRS